jgi:hypothetical protein
MDQSPGGGTQVVIRLDQRVFYGLIAVIGVVGIFALGIFLGRGLSRTAGTPAVQQQAAAQQNRVQVQPGQEIQLNQAQAVQSQAGQADPFQQPAQAQAKPPAGDDVAVGDNPRLAIPELVDKNYVWDFGDVGPEQKVEHTFIIKNNGTKELEILDVKGNCGCTGTFVDPSKKKLAPGGETELLVTYDPRVNKDKGTFVSRKVRIASTDPVAPVAEFTINANVTN